jgi:hypothetical protein
MRIIQFFGKLLRIRVLGLGSYGNNFFPTGIRFDHNFYIQAEIDFNKRWNSFLVTRNSTKENHLYNLLNPNQENYIFLHEDSSRGYLIDRDYIPSSMRIITPSADPTKFDIFDYRKIIEKACEIHVIESSFAAYIESLDINVPLFAHRYSRPHASNDFRHEFTYRKKWNIIRKISDK